MSSICELDRKEVVCIQTTEFPHNLADHDQQRSSRFSPTVKPEAPSAVVCS